ncbi:MAG: DUF2852 domain-containing protein [Alphaproteobacteria bacterium]
MSSIAARLDELPRPAWIALMVVAFIVFWPIGLGILAYLIWSGRMGCSWRHDRSEWRERRERMHDAAHRWWHGGSRQAPSSGNRAFDEYRADTLRRLEDEQKEFRDFLDQLRHAKDKAEFDQFMDDRRRRRDAPPPSAPPPVPPEPAR